MKIQTQKKNKLGQENAVRVFIATGRAFIFGGSMRKRTMRDPNEIIIKGDIAEVVLYDKHCEEVARTIIDTEDIEKIKKYKWYLSPMGYVGTKLKGKALRLPHVIMGTKPDKKYPVDHKDRDKLNNCKSNFRFCSHAENLRNAGKSKNNTSGYKGVFWQKDRKKWIAQIKINNKIVYLGIFKNKVRAAITYNKAAVKYFGEFAYLNKI